MKRDILFFCLTLLQHHHVVERLRTVGLVTLGFCLLCVFVAGLMCVLYILLSQVQ